MHWSPWTNDENVSQIISFGDGEVKPFYEYMVKRTWLVTNIILIRYYIFLSAAKLCFKLIQLEMLRRQLPYEGMSGCVVLLNCTLGRFILWIYGKMEVVWLVLYIWRNGGNGWFFTCFCVECHTCSPNPWSHMLQVSWNHFLWIVNSKVYVFFYMV